MRNAVLKYAEAKGLPVREQEHAFVVEVPKGESVFEVTVLKENDVLEWFIAARDAATGEEVYATYSEHYATQGERHAELVRELEESVLDFLSTLASHEVRVVQQPLLRIFGRSFGHHKRLEFKSGSEWRGWESLNSTSSA